jgi:hypothetical protein
MSTRINAVALAFCIIVAAGCEKSGTSGGSGTVYTPSSTSVKGAGDEAYSKKLVGVWEGKEDVGGKDADVTVEFKADGSMKMAMGPFEMKGTWKVTKEEGKTVTLDTEMTIDLGDPKLPTKSDKKTLTAAFEDANTIVLQKVGEKPDPLKLKRKK